MHVLFRCSEINLLFLHICIRHVYQRFYRRLCGLNWNWADCNYVIQSVDAKSRNSLACCTIWNFVKWLNIVFKCKMLLNFWMIWNAWTSMHSTRSSDQHILNFGLFTKLTRRPPILNREWEMASKTSERNHAHCTNMHIVLSK